ncbi:MAG: SLC13 family permease [Bacillota bacterium]|jgi:anion transporter
MSQVTITLFILVAALVLFVTELVPLGITPLIVLSSLSVSGVLSVKEVLTGFSNDTTVMVLFMFPVGEALFRTGVCEWIGRRVIRGAGKSEVKLVGFTMLAAAFLSAFTSNTGTTIVMAPLIMSVAREARVSASTLLLPLAFGASFGGMLTLVGTPPNAIVQGALREATGTSFGFFDFAKASLPFVAAAVLYMMFVGRKQVPARLPPESPSGERMEFRREKMGLSFVVLALVITGMLFEGKLSAYGLGLPIVAMIGAILTVVTRCITMKEFTESIEWSSVLLMGGMQPLGLAMQKTGAADLLARFLTGVIDNPSPIVLTGVVVVFAGLLAQFMSHTAATSVLAPVCVAIALQLGVSPAPLLMGLCQATSIAVATPIGTPPNVIVYHRGGYRFTDFVRTGLPLFVIGALTLSALIPVFFPF